MSPNGAQCCALEICCPPGAAGEADEKAVVALGNIINNHDAARQVLDHFELADRGTLTALKASMRVHAKHA